MVSKDLASQPGVIDVLRITLDIWKNRGRIIKGTVLATLLGVLYVFFATPIYHSEAVLVPKETQKNGGSAAILSQLGGLGGVVATQLGMANTNIDRTEIIVKSRELAEKVIENNALMPLLFYKDWDKTANGWKSKDSTKIPRLRDGVELLRKKYLEISINKKSNTLTIGINSYDPVLSERIVNGYVRALNEKVRGDIIQDAERNREYLEMNAKNTTDPLVSDKIQSMIASEIERMMLVNSQSFDVLEKPIVSDRAVSPRKIRVILSYLSAGVLLAVGSLLFRRFWCDVLMKWKTINL